MALKQWDIAKVPGYLLGLPEELPDQFGVVISSDTLLQTAQRYWVLQVANPEPSSVLDGDVEVPELSGLFPMNQFIVRTHTIFAVHELDLEGSAVSQLPKSYRKTVMKHVNGFLPRGGLSLPGR